MFEIEATIRVPEGGGRRAVVADDDPGRRAVLCDHLSRRGYAVFQALDGYEALSLIGAEAPALAVMQCHPVDGAADRAAALACLLYPRTRIILTAEEAVDCGSGPDGESPFTVLARPLDLALLDRCLDSMAPLQQ